MRVAVERQAELSRIELTWVSTVFSVSHSCSRDSGVRLALRHQPEHLALARGELGQGVVFLRRKQQLLHHLGVERRAAVHDAFRRLEKLVDVEHAVLEQVAEAAPGADERDRVAALDVLGEDEHRRRRDGGRRISTAARMPSSS